MGGGQSKLLEELLQTFEIEQNYEHQQFGTVMALRNKQTNNLAYLKEYVAQSKEQFNITYDALQQSRNNQYDHLVRTIDVRTEEQNEFCSTIFKIYHIFEYVTDLRTIISQKNNVPFQESELFDWTNGTAKALQQLEASNYPCNNLQPSTMYIQNNEGNVCLANPQTFDIDTEHDKSNLVNYNQLQEIYLSPEQYQIYLSRQLEQPYDRDSSNVYTLGMCLLNASTLQSQDGVYVQDQIDQNQIEGQLNELSNMYSSQFLDLLYQMLQQDPNQRLNLQQVIDYTNQFVQQQQQQQYQGQDQPILQQQTFQQQVQQQPQQIYQQQVPQEQVVYQTQPPQNQVIYQPQVQVQQLSQTPVQQYQPVQQVVHQQVINQQPIQQQQSQQTDQNGYRVISKEQYEALINQQSNQQYQQIQPQSSNNQQIVYSQPPQQVVQRVEQSQQVNALNGNAVKTISREEYERIKLENEIRDQDRIAETVKYGTVQSQQQYKQVQTINQSNQFVYSNPSPNVIKSQYATGQVVNQSIKEGQTKTISKEEFDRIRAQQAQNQNNY